MQRILCAVACAFFCSLACSAVPGAAFATPQHAREITASKFNSDISAARRHKRHKHYAKRRHHHRVVRNAGTSLAGFPAPLVRRRSQEASPHQNEISRWERPHRLIFQVLIFGEVELATLRKH